MSMVAVASDNVNNSIDFNIVNNSSAEWLHLQNDYDLDKYGTYDNDETAVAFSYMTFIGQGWSNRISDEEDNQAPVLPGCHLDFFSCYLG